MNLSRRRRSIVEEATFEDAVGGRDVEQNRVAVREVLAGCVVDGIGRGELFHFSANDALQSKRQAEMRVVLEFHLVDVLDAGQGQVFDDRQLRIQRNRI